MNGLKQKDLLATENPVFQKAKGMALRLEVRNMGHVPTFKNNKMILGIRREMGPDGKPTGKWLGTPFIATKTEYKHLMERIILSFVSQLHFASRTICTGTLTERQAHSLIALLVPENDSCPWLDLVTVKVEKVEKGQEGADIVIRANHE